MTLEAKLVTMPYTTGERVTVRVSDLDLPDSVRSQTGETLTGRILQRCGPEAYDILLDHPPSSELTLLSWVPESAIRPTSKAAP